MASPTKSRISSRQHLIYLLILLPLLIGFGRGQEEVTTAAAAGVITVSDGDHHEIRSTSDHHKEDGEEGEQRYHVAHFDFHHVETPFIISLWILVASASKIGFHLSSKLDQVFPESCMLVMLGLVVGIILYFSKVASQDQYTMTATLFFLYLLPPIVLEAGYFMPNRAFFDNLGTILTFAVVGTVFNAATIGLSLYALSEVNLFGVPIPLLHCLLFSTLISAVDPVAVLAVFEEVHVNEILHIIVFGESLLNDAVTVVLYKIFQSFSEIGVTDTGIIPIDIVAGVSSFFVVALGGTGIGVLWGLFTAFVTRFTDHVRVIEPIFVFVMSYMAYLMAEMFHLSGIMSIVFCGITMKQYVESNISQKSHTTVKYFMKMMASCSETIIFMFLGLSTVIDNHEWNTWFVVATLLFCLIYRTLGVILLTWVVNRFRLVQLNRVEQFVMAYGGLRGAVSFSLVFLLDESVVPLKQMFVTATIAEIFFTVFLQGMTIKPLVNCLHVKRADKHKPTMNEEINERMMDHIMAGVEDIAGHHGHHYIRDKFEYYNSKYLEPFLTRDGGGRDHQIVEVFTKLNIRDAMDHLSKHGTLSGLDGGGSLPSLSHLIRNYSAGHNLNYLGTQAALTDVAPTPTVLDLNELDAQYTKRDADDAKTHHLLSDSMFKTRKRHKKYTRHLLPEEENHAPFHHNRRLVARHFISKAKKHKQIRNGHGGGGKGDVESGRANGRDVRVSEEEKQSVDVKEIPAISYVNENGQETANIDNQHLSNARKPLKTVSFSGLSPNAATTPATTAASTPGDTSDDDEGGGGITFRARPDVSGSMVGEISRPRPPPPKCSAIEHLPWKREEKAEEQPQPSACPSWVRLNSLDDTVPPPSDEANSHQESPQLSHEPAHPLPPPPSSSIEKAYLITVDEEKGEDDVKGLLTSHTGDGVGEP